MSLLVADTAITMCGAPDFPKSHKGCARVSMLSIDLLLTITSLIVGILGLTAVLNLPAAASATFVAVGIAIPVLYIAAIIIICCNGK